MTGEAGEPDSENKEAGTTKSTTNSVQQNHSWSHAPNPITEDTNAPPSQSLDMGVGTTANAVHGLWGLLRPTLPPSE